MGGLGLTGRLFAPSLAEEAGQAAGEYPDLRNKQLQDQASTAAAQFQAASPRISFLAQMASANPLVAQNQQYKDTLGKLFSSAGLGPVPLKPDGSVDVTALGGMDAQHKFVTDNWQTLMGMAPDKRQTYAQTAAGVTLPDVLMDPNKFPQMTITTPTQAVDVLNKMNTDLGQFGLGRIGLAGITTQLDLFEKPLRDMGYGAQVDALRNQLKDPNFIGQAAVAYIQGQLATKQLRADQAAAMLAKLPGELRNLQVTGDLKQFEAQFYQVKAADMGAVDQSVIDKNHALSTEAYARADEATAAAAKDRVQTTQLLQTGDTKLLGTVLSTFKGRVDAEQGSLDNLLAERKSANIDLGAAKADSTKTALAKQLSGIVADYDQRIKKVQNQLASDRDLYGRAARKASDVTGLPSPSTSLPSYTSIAHPSEGMKASSPDHPGVVLVYHLHGPKGAGWYGQGSTP